MDFVASMRLIFGALFVLFLPGFAWSYLFFARNEIDWIERIALSFGLSIALVPLAIFWLNYLLGVRINLVNVTAVILFLILIPIGIKRLEDEGKLEGLRARFKSMWAK